MARVLRLDSGELAKPIRTGDEMVVEGYAGRPGVYKYRRQDGSEVLELRPDEEVFAPDSIASYRSAPIVDDHHGLIAGDPDKRAKHGRGAVFGARQDGERIAVRGAITDPTLQAKVESGKRQLSPGHTCIIDRTPGTHPKYGRYDQVQREIRVDHLAVCDEARGGRDLAIRFDDAETAIRVDSELSAKERDEMDESDFALPEQRKLPIRDHGHVVAAMGGHGLSAVEGVSDEDKKKAAKRIVKAAEKHGIDASDFAEKHLGEKREDNMADVTGGDGTVATLKERVRELETQLAAKDRTIESDELKKAKERADAATEKLRQYEETREDDIRRAAELRIAVGQALPDVRTAGKSDRDIRIDVIKRLRPAERLDGKDDKYLVERADSLVQLAIDSRAERGEIGQRREVRQDRDERADAGGSTTYRAEDLSFEDQWMAGLPRYGKGGRR